MSPPKWATEVQLLWLKAFVPKFREHQAKATVRAFWPFIRQKWFSEFPEWNVVFGPERTPESLTLEEKELYALAVGRRKKQLYNWFNNYQGDLGRKALQVKPLSAYLLKMCLQPRGHRALQLSEFYSQTFYAARVKWFVDTEIAACIARGEKPNTIAIVKRVTRERFESETDDFKDYVHAMWVSSREESAIDADDDDEEPEPTPESYEESISDLPAIVNQLLAELASRTGWTFMMACGGPQPSDGGALRCISMHAGPLGEGGCNYAAATPDFEKTTIKPLMNFMKGVYPRSVRDSRALGIPEAVLPNHPGAVPPSEEYNESNIEQAVPMDMSADMPALELDTISEGHNGDIFEGLLLIPGSADVSYPEPTSRPIDPSAMHSSAPAQQVPVYPPSVHPSSVHLPPAHPSSVTFDSHPQLMGATMVSSAASSVSHQDSVQQSMAINPSELPPGMHLAHFDIPDATATATSGLDLSSNDLESTYDFCDVDLDLNFDLDSSYDMLSDFDNLMDTFSAHEGLLGEFRLPLAQVPSGEAEIHPVTHGYSAVVSAERANADTLAPSDTVLTVAQPSKGSDVSLVHLPDSLSQSTTQGRPRRNIRAPLRRDEEISLAPKARGSYKRALDTNKESDFAGPECQQGEKRRKM
ncbi:hypothetical protein CERSUDRAFT_90152 [Gelatoporia subvermispora B]|uniref:Uncharacterized protein n=1 Tax=Ceriporiopsis subvermispora (strain B) TaxID=914234 RepID=M2QWT1_CERS8|nr:hypothetical protein CERSUDRAFT_90152 [Gelatoporia subvermispora B]